MGFGCWSVSCRLAIRHRLVKGMILILMEEGCHFGRFSLKIIIMRADAAETA